MKGAGLGAVRISRRTISQLLGICPVNQKADRIFFSEKAFCRAMLII